MSQPYNFGWFPDGVTEAAYHPPNTWTREKTSGPDRLAIAPQTDQVELLRTLSETMPAPFTILYVLVVPRTERQPGRYQSAEALNREELGAFLSAYRDFLERDGRHNLWIRAADNSMLIYDRHNVIYAYGRLEELIAQLQLAGLTQASQVHFPDPHVHHYNSEYDAEETRLLDSRTWIHSPLRSADENAE